MIHLSATKRLSKFLLILLSGCSQFQNAYHNTPVPLPKERYSQSGITEILAFGAEMANMNESSRTEKCKALISLKETPGDHQNIQLMLMVGRLVSDQCGDIPVLLEELDRLVIPGDAVDLQHLIALHKFALIRIYERSQKLSSLEQKRPKAKPSADAKDTQKNETRILREKLEAIRSMEKRLDESSGN